MNSTSELVLLDSEADQSKCHCVCNMTGVFSPFSCDIDGHCCMRHIGSVCGHREVCNMETLDEGATKPAPSPSPAPRIPTDPAPCRAPAIPEDPASEKSVKMPSPDPHKKNENVSFTITEKGGDMAVEEAMQTVGSVENCFNGSASFHSEDSFLTVCTPHKGKLLQACAHEALDSCGHASVPKLFLKCEDVPGFAPAPIQDDL